MFVAGAPDGLSGGPFERIEGATRRDWTALLGRKVSIRYRIPASEGATASEAIGVVMSVEPDDEGIERVQIVNRRGSVRSIRIRDVVAGKVWPLDG